jgi:flagellar biosynthesis component FlhA
MVSCIKKIAREGHQQTGKEHSEESAENPIAAALAEDTAVRQEEMKCFDLLTVDAISIELGRGLMSFIDPEKGAELTKRCGSVMRHFTLESGIVMPSIRYRDNFQLKPNWYIIKIRGSEAVEGAVMVNCFFAMGPKERLMRLPGWISEQFNGCLPGKWIEKSLRSRAERSGCVLTDPVSVIASHLGDVCRRHASEFLGYQEVHALLERYRKKHPEAVSRVYPALLPLRIIRKILQNLVRESISVSNLVTILEALAVNAGETQNVEKLTEYSRTALSKEICRDHMDSRGEIYAITLDQDTENNLSSMLIEENGETFIDGDNDEAQAFLRALGEKVAICSKNLSLSIIVCSPALRPALWKFTVKSHPEIVVLSRGEIAHDVKVIDWQNRKDMEMTVGGLILDKKLEKWFASFIIDKGEEYDIKLDKASEKIFIKAIEKVIKKLESPVDALLVFFSEKVYKAVRGSRMGDILEKKLHKRFPKLHFWRIDQHMLELCRKLITVTIDE